jgi:hypothetical protein
VWRGVARCVGLLVLTLATGAARAEDKGGDFGTISLWEISGITGPTEAYENQLALVFEPSLKLGRLLPRAPRLLRGLHLSAWMTLQFELAGNDARFRGVHFTSPTLLAGGAEGVAINEYGMVTGSDTSQIEGTSRRPLLSDLWLSLSHGTLYTIPKLKIDLGPTLSFTLPTSKPSQVAGLRLGLGMGFTLSRTLFKRLELTYTFKHTQYFYNTATAQTELLGGEVMINGRLEPIYSPQRGTSLNPSFGFLNDFSATVRIWRQLQLSLSYTLINAFTYTLSGVEMPGIPQVDVCADAVALAQASGGSVVRCGDRAERDTHWFMAYLEYPIIPSLTVLLRLSTLQPVRHEGGNISNPVVQTARTANYTTIELGFRADLELATTAVRRLVGRRGRR